MVFHVAGRHVGAEPFTNQTRVAGSFGGEGIGTDRLTVGHCPVQPELFADDDIGQHRRAAHVVDQFAHEFVELRLIHHVCS
ncbi:hypothetical protein D3C81_1804870 [compost metagenome]